MTNDSLRMVVGLGNPGASYEKTRHNIGFMVLDRLCGIYSISLDKRKFDSLYGRGLIQGLPAILMKPMTFMNRSGSAVRQMSAYFGIPVSDILVIHDDIDLILGRLKIKEKGGHGGHNGVRSIIDAFGGGDFHRLRIGIGRPEGEGSVSDYVLGKPDPEEKGLLERIVEVAGDAAVTVLTKGTREGMNRFNNRNVIEIR